jgi:16S rRNA (cytidine1402-2'-O)-methyltransferase
LESLINRLKSGEKLALVSEAGTPGISDPGFLLIRECLKNNIEVECLPGATALIPAIVNSGLPCETFLFTGFLPNKKGRKSRMEELSKQPNTIIFYESPFRLLKTLEQLKEYFGAERKCSVSRELTKIYEETRRGTVEEILSYFRDKTIKGEIVIVVEGRL